VKKISRATKACLGSKVYYKPFRAITLNDTPGFRVKPSPLPKEPGIVGRITLRMIIRGTRYGIKENVRRNVYNFLLERLLRLLRLLQETWQQCICMCAFFYIVIKICNGISFLYRFTVCFMCQFWWKHFVPVIYNRLFCFYLLFDDEDSCVSQRRRV
jgi:hypothetical protein